MNCRMGVHNSHSSDPSLILHVHMFSLWPLHTQAAVALVRRTQLSCARRRQATATKTAERHSSSSSSSGRQAAPPPRSPPSGAPPPKPRKASLFSGYNALLESRPLATKAATSAAIGERGPICCGDQMPHERGLHPVSVRADAIWAVFWK